MYGGIRSVMVNTNSLSLLANPNAEETHLLIGQTEILLTALDPTEVDLTPAKEALTAAKSLLESQEFSRAFTQAKRAAALAASLNERFTDYLAAWKSLQACRDELGEIGFPADGLDDALSAADKEVVRQVAEGDTLVPNYAGATAMLTRATDEARALVVRARHASREIFLATLAVESLSEPAGVKTPSWLGLRLEEMVMQASRELALGNLMAAEQVASEARARAHDALAGMARVWELLDMAAAMLDGLGAEGRIADSLARKIGSVREALSQGFLDQATALEFSRRISDEVAGFSSHYPASRRLLDQAQRLYARLQGGGFCSYDVDNALYEARRALDRGEWGVVKDRIEDASKAFLRLRRDQDVLARSIKEVDERVHLLVGFRLPLLPDVQELLTRAKEETASGRIAGAEEDLLLAKALMTEATRTGS